MNWKSLVAVGCVVAFAGVVPSARGDAGGEQTSATERETPLPGAAAAAPAAAPAQEEMSDFDKTVQNIKNPTSWFRWGADLRIREEYIKNSHTLENDQDDTINMFRIRPRIWGEFGPLFQDSSLNVPNGLSLFVRITSEPRIYYTRPTTGPLATSPTVVPPPYANPVFLDEVIVDNLYVEWKRPGGIPLDFKVGRQDLTYGRGWLILDGTPLDGSRSIYSDAAKMTVHFDDVKTDVDLFVADNKANEDRLAPFTFQVPAKYGQYVSEYDTKLAGIYLKTRYFKPAEVNLYYIYKDDQLVDQFFYGVDSNGRIVHTLGGLVQGPFLEDPSKKTWDYYLESAYQWGNEGAIAPIYFPAGTFPEMRRSDWGLNSELGYTFREVEWTPRAHVGFEYLSGDDPHASTWGGWDPILSRWPECSELYVYRWEFEGRSGLGVIGAWSNMYRFNVGASANPTPKMTLALDYNYMLADYHSFSNFTNVFAGMEAAYAGGSTRGHLIVAKLLYDFNKYVSGHLWAEYFIPGDYYASGADNAVFLRWELTLKF